MPARLRLPLRLRHAAPLLAALLLGCEPPAPVAPPAPAVPTVSAARVYALLINGGGQPAINYQQNLLHLQAMRDTLLGAGVAADRITILSGDGADPAPDLAVPEAKPDPDFFLLRGTRQERALGVPKVLVNSEIRGAALETASKDRLAAWFAAARTRLRAGDTLLLHVTDHGTRDRKDPLDNTILLWQREKLTVRDLGALLDQLNPGVRVVALMSQCYSGAFAALATRKTAGASFCGYFAAPADRPSYGCYADDRHHERTGHAARFIQALATTRSFAAAHDTVLTDDDAPDAPLRTSDIYLDDLLHKQAEARGVTVEALAGELLGPAFRDDPAHAADRALIDRIGALYGLGSPRTLAEIAALQKELPEIEHGFEVSSRAYRAAWLDAAADNVRGFLAADTSWNQRAGDLALKGMDPTAARALSAPFLKAVAAHTRPELRARIERYRDRAETLSTETFRNEVRTAAALRVRAILTDLAGRAHLDRGAPAADRQTYEALRACEDLRLPPAAPSSPAPAAPPAPIPVPPIAAARALEASLRPAWAGFNTTDISAEIRRDHKLPDGAVGVSAVYPDSPASAAGLEIGDLVIGPPGHPFTAHGDARAWALFAPEGRPAALEILRAQSRVTVTLTPAPLPLRLPSLPPALTIGSAVPALDLRAYRGPKPALNDGKPHLLMFWATWCVPCKKALPELLAFERRRKVQVIAVTDEDTETLDTFFKGFKGTFPASIAVDDLHRAFDVFAAKTRPLFVLIDDKGKVVSRTAGYDPAKGLGVEGWSWKGK